MVKGDYTVYLTVIDSYVYDFDQNVVDIIYGLQNYDRVILDMKKETPDFTCLGITDTIEKIIKTYNVEFGRIVLLTTNRIEPYDKIKVQYIDKTSTSEYFFHNMVKQEVERCKVAHDKHITKHFGCFVGRSNYSRLAFASHLHTNYNQKSTVTFHLDPSTTFHKSHIGIEKLLHLFGTNNKLISDVFNFIPKVPITLDEHISEYPITIGRNSSEQLIQEYKNIFLDIVCETFTTGETFSQPTDKLRRCILTKTPFLLFGPKSYLSNLKKVGFKTFDHWWNEDYDFDGDQHRITSMIKLINDISTKTNEDLNQMYSEMREVLDHNYNLFLDRINTSAHALTMRECDE